MACFLVFCKRVFDASADFGNDDGAVLSGIERYDDETLGGEKPRTTLVALCSDGLVVELPVMLERIELLEVGVADAFVSGLEMIGSAAVAGFGDGFFAASGARYE